MELKKRLEKLLERHTKKAVVSCDETCMCWEIEALLCDLDVQAEKSAQQKMYPTKNGRVKSDKVSTPAVFGG